MDTERAQQGGAPATVTEPDTDGAPICVATVNATVSRALRTNVGRLDVGVLTDLEALLRGHIALLLPPEREASDRLWHGSIEWHRQTARLDGIERQTQQGLGETPLAAHIQVQQLARDCQWLLNQHTGRQT